MDAFPLIDVWDFVVVEFCLIAAFDFVDKDDLAVDTTDDFCTEGVVLPTTFCLDVTEEGLITAVDLDVFIADDDRPPADELFVETDVAFLSAVLLDFTYEEVFCMDDDAFCDDETLLLVVFILDWDALLLVGLEYVLTVLYELVILLTDIFYPPV